MSDPIHNFSEGMINDILHTATKFIEWEIEPKFYQLNVLIESIKSSMIYFLPEDEEFIKNINTVDEATRIINTFRAIAGAHPLKEGLVALRHIFQIINSDGKNFSSLPLKWVLNDYLETIKPYILEEKVNKHNLAQSKKASKERTLRKQRRGQVVIIDPETRRKRNNEIFIAWENKKTSPNSFYISQGKKHDLSRSAIRKIIESQFAPNRVKCNIS